MLHCEILGSYLLQPHQYHVFRGHFEAEPHSQAKGKKIGKFILSCVRSILTDSVVTDKTSLPRSVRKMYISVGKTGTNAYSELLCFATLPLGVALRL